MFKCWGGGVSLPHTPLCPPGATQGGTGGVSFANKNVSGLQIYLRFQNKYNKVEIELRVVQFWT
jgi:hypothetical protein